MTTQSSAAAEGESPTRWSAPLLVLAAGTAVLAALTGGAWSQVAEERPSETSRSVETIALSGRDLFMAKGCATCHDGPSSQASVQSGPDLGVVREVASSREPGQSASDYIRRSITSPSSFLVPGFATTGMGAMPTLAVSPAEVDALVAYLLE